MTIMAIDKHPFLAIKPGMRSPDMPIPSSYKLLSVWITSVSIALSFLFFSYPCTADELEPRLWAHLPLDTNFIGAGYALTQADISFDPVLKIEDGNMDMDSWVAKYIRTFSVLEKTARVEVLQAYQEGHWSGLLNGAPRRIKRSGWSDAVLRLAIDFYGAPALKGEEYARYRAATPVETILGAGLSVQLPTGDYMHDKLINLGTNRYTFRPQLGVIHTRGKWSAEATGQVAVYTDNDDFFNGKTLEQDPLYFVNGHLIYMVRPGVWLGVSTGYEYGGRSTVDDARNDDLKQNLLWALSVGFPVHSHIGIKMGYIGSRTQEKTGSDSDTVSIGFSAYW